MVQHHHVVFGTGQELPERVHTVVRCGDGETLGAEDLEHHLAKDAIVFYEQDGGARQAFHAAKFELEDQLPDIYRGGCGGHCGAAKAGSQSTAGRREWANASWD